MAAPVRLNRNVNDPLMIKSIEADCPSDYIAGDPYYVNIWFNRELDPYEERAARDARRDFEGLAVEYHRLRTRTEMGDIDPYEIAEFVRTISEQAAMLRQQGDVERKLRAQAQRLLQDVKRHSPA